MKKFLKYMVLRVIVAVALVIGSSYLIQTCYRYPTIDEMIDYHEGHYSTEVVEMEELGNNKIYLRFRAKHIISSGPEVYNVNIPLRGSFHGKVTGIAESA